MSMFKTILMFITVVTVTMILTSISDASVCVDKTIPNSVQGIYLGWIPGGEFDQVCIVKPDGIKLCVVTDAEKEDIDAAFGKPGQKVVMHYDFKQWKSGNSCVKMDILRKVDKIE